MNCVLATATPRELKDDEQLNGMARAIAFHFVQDLDRLAAQRPPDVPLTFCFLLAVELDEPVRCES